jgi:hypothetical protein
VGVCRCNEENGKVGALVNNVGIYDFDKYRQNNQISILPCPISLLSVII